MRPSEVLALVMKRRSEDEESFGNVNRYLDRGTYFQGGRLNVCWEDNVGNRSNWWLHDVYLTILLFLIHRDPIRKDHLLQEAIEDE